MKIHYEEIMQYYHRNETPHIYKLPVFRHEYHEIESIIGKTYRILDFGCGKGLIYERFLSALPLEISYVGIDIDPSLKGKVNFELHESLDAFESAGYKARSFDGLFLLDSLEHMPLEEGHETLLRLNRYIDGDLVIMTPNSKSLDYIFNDPQHKTIYPAHYLYGLAKYLGFQNVNLMRGKGIYAAREDQYRQTQNPILQEMNQMQVKVCQSMGLDWFGNILMIAQRGEDNEKSNAG